MTDKETYEAMKAVVGKEIPGFEVRYKNEVWHQKLVGLLMFFNKRYMTTYTSTFYPCVYYPDRAFEEKDYGARFRTLSHEYVHLWDNKASRLGFPVSYLSPQIWALLSLGAIGALWSLWFLLFLCALVFVSPIPSPWRSRWEMRGYGMNLFIEYHKTGTISEGMKEGIAKQFTGSGYYFMCPSQAGVAKMISEKIQAIESGKIMEGQEGKPYRDVLAVLQKEE